MEKVVFVLGLPGSGKSSVARHLLNVAQARYNCAAYRLNDYDILYQWSRDNKRCKQFSSTQDKGYDGFDVHDFKVFDEALQEINKGILQWQQSEVDHNSIIIVEFSRDDYARVLKEFFPEFLQNAFFLFIETDIPTCKQRIKDRIENPLTPDDHYVSDYIFEAYYQNDMGQYITSTVSKLQECCSVNEERCKVINNPISQSEQSFLEEVDLFVASIFGQPIVARPCK